MLVSNWLLLLRARMSFLRRQGSTIRKRDRQSGIRRFVVNPEERTLLSGVTAADDSLVVEHQNAAVVIDVLSNDSAPQTSGGGFGGGGFGGGGFGGGPDTGDSDSLEITSVSSSANGTVSIQQGDGDSTDQIVFTANDGFVGTETLTYTVEAGNGESATATVSITIDDTKIDPPAETDDNPPLLTQAATLSNGFTPDANTAFESNASGNYSFTTIVDQASSENVTTDGITYNVATDVDSSLNVVSTSSDLSLIHI